jgi:hypothetical protein
MIYFPNGLSLSTLDHLLPKLYNDSGYRTSQRTFIYVHTYIVGTLVFSNTSDFHNTIVVRSSHIRGSLILDLLAQRQKHSPFFHLLLGFQSARILSLDP